MTIPPVFELVIITAIVFFYGLAGYYNFMWCLENHRHYQRFLRMAHLAVDVMWVVAYFSVGVSILLETPLIDPSSFGATFIRPIILLSGVVNAIGARFRYLEDHCR